MGTRVGGGGILSPGARAIALAWGSDTLLLLATAVWGSTFLVVHEALREWSPFLFLALRFTIAALTIAPFVLRRGGPLQGEALRAGLHVGGFLFLGFALQTVGLVWTTPTRAAFLTGLSVVLVPSILVVFYRSVPSIGSVLGVVLATLGLALLTGGTEGAVRYGDLLVLGCAFAFAFQIVAVGRYAGSVGASRLLLGELVVVAAFGWPAALFLEDPRWSTSAEGWAALLFVSFAATVGALGAQNFAQKYTPATRAAIVFAMEPVFAAAISYLAKGESLSPAGWAGSALILAGMLTAELARGRSPAAPPTARAGPRPRSS